MWHLFIIFYHAHVILFSLFTPFSLSPLSPLRDTRICTYFRTISDMCPVTPKFSSRDFPGQAYSPVSLQCSDQNQEIHTNTVLLANTQTPSDFISFLKCPLQKNKTKQTNKQKPHNVLGSRVQTRLRHCTSVACLFCPLV
ncbi:hypothetical protein HJG60_008673 [Phyllostomus discolor]|uniref:Uncharacterized protein n=1 Tax=Phyllostomus discolor TaxID=89673 RepID=A0A834DKI3_9CHIR|nr:hypothetical protein HJG60_008673 [Phyllostomus discolor]